MKYLMLLLLCFGGCQDDYVIVDAPMGPKGDAGKSCEVVKTETNKVIKCEGKEDVILDGSSEASNHIEQCNMKDNGNVNQSFIICGDVNLEFGSFGNAECEVTPTPEGQKVVCGNGTTVYVYNGKDGLDGKDGLNGTNGLDGKDGLNGNNGTNGTNGKDGVSGKDGIDGSKGDKGDTGSGGKNGLDGEDGKDGANGTNGSNGIDGINGTNGKDGSAGTNGKDGKNGINGTNGKNGLDGKNGSDGSNGLDGKDGKDGKNGVDGTSCKVVDHPEGAKIVCGTTEQIIYDGKNGKCTNCCDKLTCEITESGGHAVWFKAGNSLKQDYIFSPFGVWEQDSTGLVRVTGYIWSKSDLGDVWSVDLFFKGLTKVAKTGSPKDAGSNDTSNWYYYESFSGIMLGQGKFDGAVLEISQMGPNMQLGIGASIHNNLFGGAAWFYYKVKRQPNDLGRCFKLKDGTGDFNWTLSCYSK